MLSVIIRPTEEPKVIQLTQENLQKELSQVVGAELLVDSWGSGLAKARNDFICLVEADCLVNSGYFSSQIGLFKKNPHFRRLAVMSSAIGVNDWATRFFGYKLGKTYADGVIPVKEKTSTSPYPLQIAYIPGAVMRKSSFGRLKINPTWENDLVYFSTMVSLDLWRQGSMIQINPNTTYVTTESYVGEVGRFDPEAADLVGHLTKAGDYVFS